MSLNMYFVVRLAFLLSVSLCFCGYVTGHKECSNYISGTSGIIYRNEFMKWDNDPSLIWKSDELSKTAPPDETAFDNLSPKEDFDWKKMYDKLKSGKNNTNAGTFLKEFSLHDVRLDTNSRHGRAQQTNLEYLLMFDVDRLVWNFRKHVGLPTPGTNYSSWEAADHQLRGHFVGHFMSATAHMWASTHNETIKQRAAAVVSVLYECQQKIGTGYLSAFSTDLFDWFEEPRWVWAPYYTIHKIMAGLLDQYQLVGDARALKMLTWMADYFFGRIQSVIAKYSLDRHWRALNTEYGGMNDIYYKLYAITQNPKYFVAGHLFDKPCFLGALALKVDDIASLHTNTHVPIIVGAQKRYEITGEPLYRDIAIYFMDIINNSHRYAPGGTSVHEFWVEPNRLADTLVRDNEESCVTYNMLKVSRSLFKWTKEMVYADYYERALTNHVLSIQRGTEPGVMLYFMPLGPGSSKAKSQWGWSKPLMDFWCCLGTATESFSKMGDSIYFEENGRTPALYIIQFISSTLNWKNGGVSINMKVQEPVTSWDPYLRLNLTVAPNVSPDRLGKSITMHLRIPFWTSLNGAKASVNGQALSLPNPGSYLSITRKWNYGDELILGLPMNLRTEHISDERPKYANVQAIFYGRYLLVGLTGGDWDLKGTPNAPLSNWITPIPATYNSHLISLSQQAGNSKLFLSGIGDSITMKDPPLPGTNESLHTTFRVALKNSSEFSQPKDVIGKPVILEPIHLPGKVVSYSGKDQGLVVSDPSLNEAGSVFNLVAGLDGKPGTVSLESESQKGCFVHGGNGTSVKLSCNSASDAAFKQATSFLMESGTSSYDPISFVAKGVRRNFLLSPLHNLRDEYYTVYFNIQA